MYRQKQPTGDGCLLCRLRPGTSFHLKLPGNSKATVLGWTPGFSRPGMARHPRQSRKSSCNGTGKRVRAIWLVGLYALTICFPIAAESGVLRISQGVETTVFGDQVRVRLTIANNGGTPALDVQAYVDVGGSRVPFAGKRRLDPRERYQSEKLVPLQTIVDAAHIIRSYVEYADAVGQRTTSMLLARVGDPGARGSEGLRLSLSPPRLSVDTSAAAMSLRIGNSGSKPREVRIEAFPAPSCEPPEGLPDTPIHLPASGGEVLLTLYFPPSPCERPGEHSLYILATELGEGAGKPAVATGRISMPAPRSLLRQVFGDKARVLWAAWACLLLLIASVAMGIRRT